VLTMVGGFALSAVSIGWADGTYNNIINMFTRNRLGHIQIHGRGYLDKPTLYNVVRDFNELGNRIGELPHVEAWSPRLYASGLVSVENKSAGARLIGMDPVLEENATSFKQKLVKGEGFSEKGLREAILGKGLAQNLKADPGDELVIVSQAADGSIANDLFGIVGIIQTDDVVTDQSALYLKLPDFQELLTLEKDAHEIVIMVDQLAQVAPVTRQISSILSGTDMVVEPWQEFAKSFYVAMKADKQGAWIMLFVIILIVAIGVLNTVLMTVLERTREYGVLRALGTPPTDVFGLVLTEVLVMSFVSIVFGLIISIPVNYLFSIHGVEMPQPFSYGGVEFTHFYTEINAHSLYVPALTVVLSALIVSVFPALRAARVAPAQALRMH
jgi:ABC-type lipoprotein release transport system permease subunit